MPKNEEIHWYCPDCENEGVISEWQKTKWDNHKGDAKDSIGGVRGDIPKKRLYLNQEIKDIPQLPVSINRSKDELNPIPKEAREISAFFSLIIDETMEKLPSTLTPTGIRCFKKRCTGIISSKVDLNNNEIYWKCSKCRNNGTITGIAGCE